MANVFISYNRKSKAIVQTLAGDLRALGYTVWFDQELSGGEVWWDQILARVRDCDVFVFVLNPEALKSTACNREYSYAHDLGKPILPVFVAKDVRTNLLPSALSQIQFVDYLKQDRDAAIRLARALSTIPAPQPLPDPLPVPPEVPISYLGTLSEQVESPSNLSFEAQSALVVDLKRSLRDPETTEDAQILFESLRKRRDLLSTIGDEIDELLSSTRKELRAEEGAGILQTEGEASLENQRESESEISRAKLTKPSDEQPVQPVTGAVRASGKRLKGAYGGAILAAIISVLGLVFIRVPRTGGIDPEFFITVILVAGGCGAIAGAITGTQRRLVVAALLGAAFGLIMVPLLTFLLGNKTDLNSLFVVGFFFGMAPGAIVGAITGVIFRK